MKVIPKHRIGWAGKTERRESNELCQTLCVVKLFDVNKTETHINTSMYSGDRVAKQAPLK